MALIKGLASQYTVDLNAVHRHEEVAMSREDPIVYTLKLWLASCSRLVLRVRA